MRNSLSLMLLLGIIFSAGCQAVPVEVPKEPEVPPLATLEPDSSTEPLATPDRFDPSSTHLPERLPPTEIVPAVTGEVPVELLETIKADLVTRTGVTMDRILVIQAQSTVWNDGSLGCPQPDVFYTQALVNGYWVILEVDGTTYDYRASETGYFIICENGLPPIIPPGTPDS